MLPPIFTGPGHVTSYQHTPGTRSYRFGTGYSCPKQLSPIPPVRYWSCDNTYTGPQSIPVRYRLQLLSSIFQLCCHQFLLLRYWSCDNISAYTGGQTILVQCWLQLPCHRKKFLYCFVTNSLADPVEVM